MIRSMSVLVAILACGPVSAQDVTPRVDEAAAAVLGKPVPVTAGDITDRPYRVLGMVRATVRKTTIFDPRISEDKVYSVLWKRAAPMKPDAIVLAEYSQPDTELGRVGAREATGKAIRFVDGVSPRR